jgi:magnesium transporter
MIRDAISYSKTGTPTTLKDAARSAPKAAIAAAKRGGGFVWIGLEDPDEKEMRDLAEQLGLHPLAVMDAITGKQQPKVQSFTEHLFVVMWVLTRTRGAGVRVGGLFLFIREGMLLTVQRDLGKRPLDLASILGATETQLQSGAVGGMYGIMANGADQYSDLASEVEVTLEKLEKQVFDSSTKEDGEEIYRLRQEIGKLQRAVSSLAKALETSRDHLDQLAVGNSRIAPYLRDLSDDLAGTAQLVSDQSSALDGVVSSHENNVASQQNIDTRKISAIAALLSVPAVLAGLFGMNFKNLPGVSWTFGWEALTAAIIVIDVVMFISFRRRRWL